MNHINSCGSLGIQFCYDPVSTVQTEMDRSKKKTYWAKGKFQDKVKAGVLCGIQQPGSYWDSSTVLTLIWESNP